MFSPLSICSSTFQSITPLVKKSDNNPAVCLMLIEHLLELYVCCVSSYEIAYLSTGGALLTNASTDLEVFILCLVYLSILRLI